ncbi:ABC transporter permease [Paenibacillus sp. 32O-W]|uniref:carbohydrate ABC transporter permease n=1 Tax=Paenibacillus sp. 32O-W TaxID=1695218 RepID=UPI000722FB3B|nr:sugar ABC transporter permease [Paenibacillus sp. 32O-W]ALS25518.1 ABC transporter permease [Paenibacillus sp. 32O-W]
MKSKMSMRSRHIWEGYSFVGLWIIGFFLFMAIPLGRSLYYSFQDLKTSREGLIAEYVGLLHYRAAFTVDVNFLPLLRDTMKTMVSHVPLILIFAMASALLLNRHARGRLLFRGIFFLPVIIASGSILKKLLEQGAAQLPIFMEYDLYSKLRLFIPGDVLVRLLEYSDSLTLVMWDSGVQTLIFLAGLQTISPQLYEAAKCDGATKWESFWKITFPMILPMIFVNTLFTMVSSFTKADNHIMNHIRTVVFGNNNYGYGSAIGWIYFIIIFFLLGIVFLLFRKSLASMEGRG